MSFFKKIFGSNKDNNDIEEEEIVECYCCSVKIPYNEATLVCGDFYCEVCIDDKCLQCKECGNYFAKHDIHYIYDDAYCEYCYEKIQDRDIPDYDDNGNSDWWRDENNE